MRCSSCGLPLSPSRTRCPRCGAAKGSPGPIKTAQEAPSAQQGGLKRGAVQVSTEAPPAWDAQYAFTPSTPWNVQGENSSVQPNSTTYKDFNEQLPFPPASAPFAPSPEIDVPHTSQGGLPGAAPDQPGQLWLPPPATPAQTALQTSDWGQAGQSPSDEIPTRRALPFLSSFNALQEHSARLGFSVASLCVIIGGLILIFVHFMALGLSTPSSQASPQQVHVVSRPPTSVVTPVSSPTPSPTPVLPGQRYIDNAQMASAVSGGLPTQATTDFKVGQQINVTFMVHPNGQSGAVCLLWYLNDQLVTHYAFPVAAYLSPRPASSYAILGAAGTGSVELYWASTTACTDKQLAQRLSFSVTQ